ncbi:flagellar basal body-associated FliL family protein [Cellulomonas endometrii]|uniref:flagellar basal body-associated FliL family protein n=1 Tax=Cellulomonas endometrii TaxID=3036301 RepID=UPI0024ACA37E|nr:flagellar basal body-associated FliL family protein [Cellulomonas endometrii]
MPIEQRVIGGQSQKIGGGAKIGGSKDAPAPEPEPAPKKGKKKKLLLVIGAVVLVLGGAAAYFLLGKSGGAEAAAEEEPAPEPGAVVAVEPISLNLAQGHYLRLGFELQLIADVGEEAPEPGKAVDAAIALFSGRTIAEVSDPAVREQLKTEFLHELEELYEGEVMDVYLTNYVTQ